MDHPGTPLDGESATLRSASEVRAHYAEPSHMSVAKELDHLDHHCRAFIALSPLVVVASADAEGRQDATPGGDAPGFVLDDRTLVIPDRRGNNRVDTMLNLVANPRVGLLFLVPGINETLRVNGTARVTTDRALLEPLAADGKVPHVGVVVAAEEVFFHCGKPLIRSKLWDPAAKVERSAFPSLGKVLADQIAGADRKSFEERIETAYQTQLY